MTPPIKAVITKLMHFFAKQKNFIACTFKTKNIKYASAENLLVLNVHAR